MSTKTPKADTAKATRKKAPGKAAQPLPDVQATIPQEIPAEPVSAAPISSIERELAKLLAMDKKLRQSAKNELRKVADTKKFERYRPHPLQAKHLAAGAHYRERALLAGNQQGKTMTACFETAAHLTGNYPDWWGGRRWDRPTSGWAIGVTTESTRDTIARLLLGRAGMEGTGLIPKYAIISISKAHGVADAPDTVQVRHISGGVSSISFKSYSGGVAKLMGETLDFVHLDESPPEDVLYTECLSRTNATGGMIYLTLSPVEGLTSTIEKFYPEPTTKQRHLTRMEIQDAYHIPEDQRQAIIDSYPAHEREARIRGIPAMGSGRVFPITEESITVAPFEWPKHLWPSIIGLDFGWDHPTAAARLVWDRDNDIVYLVGVYRKSEASVLEHAGFLNAAWKNIPVAWPHDGLAHDKGSGLRLADQYREQGVNMLAERATWADGSSGLEAGVMEILIRMQTGRFKVFATGCEAFFDEFRIFHRKDGRIVAQKDDVLSAVRYGLSMMDRHAEVVGGQWQTAPRIRRGLRLA
jgi:phage terminase large subunit-like protein